MSAGIRLESYQSDWPLRFRKEAEGLFSVFGDALLEIHHIGSTAVPGLIAKPEIDILAVVTSVKALEKFRGAAEAAGFEWKGEYGIPGRLYLKKSLVQVQIFPDEHVEIDRLLAFRDYLRENEDERDAYGDLKEALAERASDAAAYQSGKASFIEDTLGQIMTDEAEFDDEDDGEF